MSVLLLVGGDVCPMSRDVAPLVSEHPDGVLGELAREFEDADIVAVNLEAPLIACQSPARTTGPTLSAPAASALGLARLGVDVAGLANNHIMDHGDAGLRSTLEVLASAGIQGVGAGANLGEALRPVVVSAGQLRVGLLGVADLECSIAGAARPGAAPMDPISVHGALVEARAVADVVIALVHAGHHMYRYPSPGLQRYCRWLIELGAAVVVCQHSHVAGAVEQYREGLIVYGQGNLLFDWQPDPGGGWSEGFLVRATLSSAGLAGFELIPHGRSRATGLVSRLAGSARTEFLAAVESRGREVTDRASLERRWRQHCEAQASSYYENLTGRTPWGKLRRRLADRFGIPWSPFSRDGRLVVGNLIRCGDHREVLETILLDEGGPLPRD